MIPHQLTTLVRINGQLRVINLSGQLGRSLPILELYGPAGSVSRLRRELNRWRRLLKLPNLNYRLTIELDQLPDRLEVLIWPLLYLLLTLGRNWPRLSYVVGLIESDGQIQPVDWFDDYGLDSSKPTTKTMSKQTLLSARFRPLNHHYQSLVIDHLDPDLAPNALLSLATLKPLDSDFSVINNTTASTPTILDALTNYLPLLLLSGASCLIAGRTGIGKSRLVEDLLQYRCLTQAELAQAGLWQTRPIGDRRIALVRLESFNDWRRLDSWPIALPTLILVPELLDRSTNFLSRLKLLFDRIDRQHAPWQLVATTNLCPCGQFPDPLCRCLTQSRQRWLSRLSPTLFDRFELVSCLVDNLQYDWPALAAYQPRHNQAIQPPIPTRSRSQNQAWRQTELEERLLKRLYQLNPKLDQTTATAILRQYRFAYLELMR